MATARPLLTLEQFHEQYDGKKPYFEFRRGEAVQKAMPTWLHNLLEDILVEMLKMTGYRAAHEVELRVNDDWRPIPDVIAASEIENPYPTRPVAVVIEILSPTDRMSDMLRKCADYQDIGIGAIFVVDPAQRAAWQWKNGNLNALSSFELPNGASIPLAAVWEQLEKQIQPRPTA